MEDDMDSDTARKIDDLLRQIDDIQKRVARLEADPMRAQQAAADKAGAWIRDKPVTSIGAPTGQFCLCGREVCRAPACPTFQPDPLGR
jgi:ElaB/YqjD/DUF883 family membrane-anchored ribosome-binding protein